MFDHVIFSEDNTKTPRSMMLTFLSCQTFSIYRFPSEQNLCFFEVSLRTWDAFVSFWAEAGALFWIGIFQHVERSKYDLCLVILAYVLLVSNDPKNAMIASNMARADYFSHG